MMLFIFMLFLHDHHDCFKTIQFARIYSKKALNIIHIKIISIKSISLPKVKRSILADTRLLFSVKQSSVNGPGLG